MGELGEWWHTSQSVSVCVSDAVADVDNLVDDGCEWVTEDEVDRELECDSVDDVGDNGPNKWHVADIDELADVWDDNREDDTDDCRRRCLPSFPSNVWFLVNLGIS